MIMSIKLMSLGAFEMYTTHRSLQLYLYSTRGTVQQTNWI